MDTLELRIDDMLERLITSDDEYVLYMMPRVYVALATDASLREPLYAWYRDIERLLAQHAAGMQTDYMALREYRRINLTAIRAYTDASLLSMFVSIPCEQPDWPPEWPPVPAPEDC